jgi:predicted secreted hydrolase
MSSTFDQILSGFEKAVSDTLESVTDLFRGEAETLRDETVFDPVSLPRDLAAHKNAQTEWWYYTGHAETARGREFGFELVFFKRRTDLDKFSIVPLRLFGNPLYFAHFAITDHAEKSFRYAHRKSANGPFDHPASANDSHFHLRLGDGWNGLGVGYQPLRTARQRLRGDEPDPARASRGGCRRL